MKRIWVRSKVYLIVWKGLWTYFNDPPFVEGNAPFKPFTVKNVGNTLFLLSTNWLFSIEDWISFCWSNGESCENWKLFKLEHDFTSDEGF